MRHWLLRILIIPLVLSWTVAAQALTISGRVLDQKGKGISGAIISDEINVVASKVDGGFQLSTEPGRVVSITAPVGYAAPKKWWWKAEQASLKNLSLRLSTRQSVNELLVALVSDPHLSDEQSGPVNSPVPAQVANRPRPLAVWDQVARNLSKLSPALTIVTGDLCADADKGDMAHAKAQMAVAAKAMAQLPTPARAIPGNHDLRFNNGKVDRSLWRRAFGPSRQVFLLPEAAFILLDNVGISQTTQGKPQTCGKLPDEALVWLKQVVELIPSGYQLYVVSHYPPMTPIAGSNPLLRRSLVDSQRSKGLALTDADQSFRRIAELLKDRNLAAFIHGHEHAGHSTTILARKPFQIFGLPALCGGWWQGDRKWGAHDFASAYALMRLKSSPKGVQPQLRIIEVEY